MIGKVTVQTGEHEPKPGKYCHFKGGEYTVLGLAFHSESLATFVIYYPLYEPENGGVKLWARPTEMFLGDVEHEGKTVKRFEYIGS